MRKKRGLLIIIISVCVVIIAAAAIYTHPVSIEKRVNATVYVDGSAESQTEIYIKGQIANEIRTKETSYVGLFQIASYERSCREGTKARIVWVDGELQYITFSQGASSSFLDVKKIMLDKQMNEIAVAFSDGTIVATSKNIYLECKNGLPE